MFKKKTQFEINQMLEKAVDVMAEATKIAKELNLRDANKFIVSNLLDYYVSQISPMTIADYHNGRQNGTT